MPLIEPVLSHEVLRRLTPVEATLVQAIQSDGPLSRTDLARRLATSRASLTPLVAALCDARLLQEIGPGESAGGRRPALLDLNPQLGFLVGLDIGGTSMDVALANFRGQVLGRHAEGSDVRDGPEAVLERGCQIIERLLAAQPASGPVLGIGVGVPGIVEFATGVLLGSALMSSWDGFSVRALLSARFPHARVIVDNDVNIMANGERWAGAGQGLEHFLFIKLGTGIGGGIVSDGRVYRGSQGYAGDVGHICVDYNGPICNCGNQGCLEAMAAGPAITARGRAAALSGASPLLAARLEQNGGALSAVDVGEAAAAGDRAANEIIESSGRMIGGMVAGLVSFMNPQAVFVGGGVSNIGHRLLSSIKQAILRRANPLHTHSLRVEYSALGSEAGVLGALWLVMEQLFVAEP